MAGNWSRLGKELGKIALREGPRLFRQLQNSGALQKGKDAIASRTTPAPSAPAGRPVSSNAVPTAHRARRVEYSPDLDGKADPGEIVWTWVTYEEDASQGKDRPVLVVGRDGSTLLGLMLSSQQKHDGDRDWVAIGSGTWDAEGRPSWIRLDRVLDVPETGIRREGAVLAKGKFDAVAARLRSEYSWS
ncbi:type II toxin-antitoxin system PemK/MazF family toxin [Rhodococcus sp. BP-252]|uniref:type II toxin-antitoxin system PemK/MazF family toxin n=1 Tax=unclassified Rhodococcus (in: high G+C Gram-positive bacteria) TaxID=192944 RepID=UPI001C9AF6C6|nr:MULTISPECIES: type II toxin-antitoxin system PemK/MazF family toxin [unclassified Rhodococcus (in: high G+C Gram-positive bacteria)]MBY6412051.1 type II toxin-antitoxin system PemK/MazF family toxin [Rhodococcus sp. BP-320]MBY6416631.1 type II toxin-antitoxin system PemK/MazF family toxin [Rhodococcus sp. BP-321]MBY6421180.1 type II toxin-antitoxin system PemK/MazF family toxin [Rhodococcus sp. BP-324]MBY6426655.1 type II toxin-antitoxin system PemK/MazF family toxin [Rhodococcus sp. BP-323]